VTKDSKDVSPTWINIVLLAGSSMARLSEIAVNSQAQPSCFTMFHSMFQYSGTQPKHYTRTNSSWMFNYIHTSYMFTL